MYVIEFDIDFKLEAAYKVHTIYEELPKSIQFYDGKIFMLLGKEMVVLEPNYAT